MIEEQLLALEFSSERMATALASSYKLILLACFIFYFLYWLITPRNRVRRVADSLSGKEASVNRRRRKVGKLPPVYVNGWYPIVEKHRVKKNEALHVAALGENFAVFRTEKGEVNILDAYCPHLGANMGVGGRVQGNCLECPFHLWQFSGDTGECTHIPTAEKVPKTAKVKKWLSFECHDYIYVWYHAENEEPSWYPERSEELNNLTFQGRLEYDINCHIQDLVENVCDVAHFTSLHEPLSPTGSQLQSYRKWLTFLKNSWEISISPSSTPEEKHKLCLEIKHTIILFGNFKLHLGLGKVLFRQLERDIDIWNNKTFTDKPVLTKEESNILKFRRWFSQFYSEHSPTYEKVMQGLEW